MIKNLDLNNFFYAIIIFVIFGMCIFFSFYKLSESPATWTDEGLIIQTAQNLAGQGIYGFQIAPGKIISSSFISTSYPVTYPIALSFKLFGISLFNARLVMALYIIFLVSAIFFIFKDRIKEQLIWALLLIGSFPPLYGHGKNVLGEIPGLFFILLSAFFIKKIEEGKQGLVNWSLFGLFFGLALSTKPIFILAVPGFLFVLIRMHFNKGEIDVKKIIILFTSVLMPVLAWFWIQFFSTDSWLSILNFYINPHSVKIIPAVILNIKDFFTHTRTLFTGGVFTIWTITLAYSYYQNRKISLFETYLYTLSLFVFILYFRNPPYYRYFFISEALSVIFLTVNLFSFNFGKLWLKNAARVFLGLLFVFQFYQLGFHSWVADSYQSHRAEIMKKALGTLPSDRPIFVYQAPETIIFLKNYNYYQYFSGTTASEFGQENLKILKNGGDVLVLTKKDFLTINPSLFLRYSLLKEFDRYVVLKPVDKN